jgi:predicted DsbA family dithiol-disulfide isomerase
MQAFETKFGGASQAKAFFERMEKLGGEMGIRFNWGGRTGSSRDSHKLLALAGRKSAETQGRLLDLLYREYMEQGEDISDPEFLVDAAGRVGLDQDEVVEWLLEESVGEEVDRQARIAVENQISAVPSFQIQGRYRVGGYQEPGVFLQVFDKVRHAQE